MDDAEDVDGSDSHVINDGDQWARAIDEEL
jgi:hypothetical protein